MSQGEKGDPGADSQVAGPAGVAGAAGAEGAVGRQGQQGEAGPAAMLDPESAAAIKKSLRGLVIATIILYLAMLGIAGYAWWTAHKNAEALCAVREDQERRVTASLQFLADNPDGIPGISAAQIKTSIENSKRTVEALSGVNC